MQNFNYLEPGSLWEAVGILEGLEGKAFPLAGGTDLVRTFKRIGFKGHGVINLKKIPELSGVKFDGQVMSIGALSTVSELLANSEVTEYFPVLAQAARALGTPQIRNLATIGGNLCTSSPASDLVPALLIYQAKIRITGPNGEREVAVNEFFKGPGQNVLDRGEILTRIDLNLPVPGTIGAFLKHGVRKSHEIALVNTAVLIIPVRGSDKIAVARIALGAVGPTPFRAWQAEEQLAGAEGGLPQFEEAAKIAQELASPIDDVRASADYRKHMAGVLVKRALFQAWGGKV
ncbi:MAG: FAD binding domain-containing protein [Desulfitobacteriaceae bacterium]